MVILTTIYVVAAVLLLFGAAIFVHEWGHFYVARKCGMKVEEFAIGFGKILWKREKDGILYTIRMIPAGGFVKLPQMLTSEAIEGKNEEEAAEPLPEISPWAKIAVAVAGPIMNVVFALVLATIIYFVGLPESITPPIVGALDKESEEYALGIREGDIITKIDGEAIPSWEEAFKFTALSLNDRIEVTFERGEEEEKTEFSQLLKATPISDEISLKRLQLPPKYPPVIGNIRDEGAAIEAGLKKHDKIISLAGIPISSQMQLVNELQKRDLVVSNVEPDMPASNAGLLVGDRIISLNGIEIISQGHLIKELQKMSPVIGYVFENQPAFAAGLLKGDRIVSFGEADIGGYDELIVALRENKGQQTEIEVRRGAQTIAYSITPKLDRGEVAIGVQFAAQYAGRETDLVVRRDGEEITLSVTPKLVISDGESRVQIGTWFTSVYGDKETEIVILRPSFDPETEDIISEEEIKLPIIPKLEQEGVVRIGIEFASQPQVYIVRDPGPTPLENVSGVAMLMWRTISALVHPKGSVGVKDLSGPVGILAMLGAWVKTDYRLALNFLVLLNINLAIINMLPIPVLDGGHTLMGFIEGIFRRKIPVKILEWTTTCFAVALITLMLYVTFHDVFERSGLFVERFKDDVEIQGPTDPGE